MNIATLYASFPEADDFLIAGALNGDLMITMVGTINEPDHEAHGRVYELRTFIDAKVIFDPGFDNNAYLESQFKEARYRLTQPTITSTRWPS